MRSASAGVMACPEDILSAGCELVGDHVELTRYVFQFPAGEQAGYDSGMTCTQVSDHFKAGAVARSGPAPDLDEGVGASADG